MVLAQRRRRGRDQRLGWRFHPTMVLAQHGGVSMKNDVIGFHPTMVLAQPGKIEISAGYAGFCFHPTMVLAQRIRWRQRRLCSLEFPSHYGSRSTKLPVLDTDVFVDRFHPTMVLAQQTGRTVIGLHVAVVSIPLWFSLNLTQGGDENADAESFPSHYGSRSTCEDITRKTHEIAVSIPLWFSLNGGDKMAEKKITSFHPTMVLAQPGSIADTVRADTFPSHYGSRSTLRSGGD